ncbi:hypothetical protein [Actinomadura roseirufa]|uniref:hypothetical protein n=1 Tax=Actinomadura roseirufa TaxID=2094049 RepID=UPI0010419BB9|nr:hypothetical protein [Actinomadura roseirufa]
MIEKVKPGERSSRMRFRKCSNDPSPPSWREWGPCDSEGYRIVDTGGGGWDPKWRNIISSFKVWNGCDIVNTFSEEDFQGESAWYVGNRAYLGDMNDRIRSLAIKAS